METIKNILKPGGNKDDEVMYGSGNTDPNRGKISGEGSHFPSRHAHTDSGVDFDTPTSPQQSAKPTVGTIDESAASREVEHIEPTSGVTGASATQTAQPGSTTAETQHIQPTSGVTGASATKTAEPGATGQREFPLSGSETAAGGAAVGGAAGAASSEWPLKDTSRRENNILEQQKEVVNTRADGSEPKYASEIPGTLEGPVHNSKILNELDPRVKAHPGSATTGGHHTVPKVGETHHGDHAARDATVGVATGAGTSAGAAAASGQTQGELEGPVHSSSILNRLDPRVKENTGSATTASGGNQTTTSVDQTRHEGHAGRDAAVGAGAGAAAGVAVREGEKFYDAPSGGEATSSQPTTSVPTTTGGPGYEYRTLDPKADPGFTNRIAVTEPPSASGGVPDFVAEQPSYTVSKTPSSSAQHSGSTAAAAAVPAAGAAGAASDQPHQAAQTPSTATTTATTTQPAQAATSDVKDKEPEHHYGRDAAIAGGAAGAGALAGHELSKKEAEDRVKEQKQHEKEAEQLEKQHEKEQKQAEKEAEKQQKEAEKEAEKQKKEAEKEHAAAVKQQEKEQKEAEKQAEKEQKEAEKKAEKEHAAAVKQQEKEKKEAEKQQEKEQKKAEKEAEKEHAALVKQQEKEKKEAEKQKEKEHAALVKQQEKEQKEAEKQAEKEQKEAEKEAKRQEKEEKPGLISRLLHRNKDDKEGEEADDEKHKHEAEGAAAGAAAGAGAGALAHQQHHNETTGTDGLPVTATPADTAAATAGPPAGTAAAPTTAAADSSTAPYDQTTATAGGAEIPQRKSSTRNRLHKDPPAGYVPPAAKNDAPATSQETSAPAAATTTAAATGASSSVAAEPQSTQSTTAPTTAGAVHSPTPAGDDVVPGTRYGSGHDEHTQVQTRGGGSASSKLKGYAGQVTGGTGTTDLAEGSQGASCALPADQIPQVVQSNTPYQPAPSKGYASQVTGGTGTTELARGDKDEAVVPDTSRRGSVADTIRKRLSLSK